MASPDAGARSAHPPVHNARPWGCPVGGGAQGRRGSRAGFPRSRASRPARPLAAASEAGGWLHATAFLRPVNFEFAVQA